LSMIVPADKVAWWWK